MLFPTVCGRMSHPRTLGCGPTSALWKMASTTSQLRRRIGSRRNREPSGGGERRGVTSLSHDGLRRPSAQRQARNIGNSTTSTGRCARRSEKRKANGKGWKISSPPEVSRTFRRRSVIYRVQIGELCSYRCPRPQKLHSHNDLLATETYALAHIMPLQIFRQ